MENDTLGNVPNISSKMGEASLLSSDNFSFYYMYSDYTSGTEPIQTGNTSPHSLDFDKLGIFTVQQDYTPTELVQFMYSAPLTMPWTVISDLGYTYTGVYNYVGVIIPGFFDSTSCISSPSGLGSVINATVIYQDGTRRSYTGLFTFSFMRFQYVIRDINQANNSNLPYNPSNGFLPIYGYSSITKVIGTREASLLSTYSEFNDEIE